ncbi:EH signature domain-containing protein [Nitrosococcus oceani]|uniref:EH signature domain-containing protein n=1 Tax=Nitrosococcus oceani TaxID=1229 RepID=UPI0004E8B824|nr:EH signature domain-containing protein [Nitrosococcus oceani]KFI23091.1 hypothetical protein HW44_05765 [Nitrosococcus oceani]
MRLPLNKLHFSLSDESLLSYKGRIDAATQEIKQLARGSGTGSAAFKQAYERVLKALREDRNLSDVLRTPTDLRAFAVSFNTELASKIRLTEPVLQKINQIRQKPTALLVDAIYAHYLTVYDTLPDMVAVENWLRVAKGRRGKLSEEVPAILGGNGPKWLAEDAHRQGVDFDEQVGRVGLDRFRSGRFMTVAKNIYYLDVLRKLEPNQDHPLLDEMQKRPVYNSRYDERHLLGHQILGILIEKAPVNAVGEAWLNAVLAIGGDPRVPPCHPNHQKWWSQLDPQLKNKAQGWLSKLDLRLFLESLEDFSCQPGKEDLKRMYPARKHFMEGLLNKQLITGTRLYLSPSAESYLKKAYRAEHLPHYSLVMDGGKALIHIQLGGVHLVEGSHNCQLWIYETLDPSAIVFNDSKTRVTYHSLTQGLSLIMRKKGLPPKANITHHPGWQYRAIVALKEIGVPIEAKDVLTPKDYHRYKRLYGA